LDTKGAVLAVAALALFSGAEAAIRGAQTRADAELQSISAHIRTLRSQAESREAAAAAAAASARADDAQARRLSEGGAPNHGRILRILKALEAAKRRHGPSDPMKIRLANAHVGMSANPDLLSDPGYADRARIIGKYNAEKDNCLLMRLLGAAGVDTARMASLLSELLLQPMEAHAIAKAEGLPDREVIKAAQSQDEDVRAQIQQLLGPENSKLYESVGILARGSFSTDQLQRRLSYEATPMDDRQFAAVSALLGGQQANLTLEGRYDPGLASRLQPILTPEQFAAYEALQREQKGP
jgi:hypothetical protein